MYSINSYDESNNFIFQKTLKRWRRNDDLVTSIMHFVKGSNSPHKYKNGLQKDDKV